MAALQAWQSHHGLPFTGAFDATSRAHYAHLVDAELVRIRRQHAEVAEVAPAELRRRWLPPAVGQRPRLAAAAVSGTAVAAVALAWRAIEDLRRRRDYAAQLREVLVEKELSLEAAEARARSRQRLQRIIDMDRGLEDVQEDEESELPDGQRG
eukprot:SM000027S09584  [mRNA]  locus=s27:95244:96338:- [translate_table: standard]